MRNHTKSFRAPVCVFFFLCWRADWLGGTGDIVLIDVTADEAHHLLAGTTAVKLD